MANRPLEIQTLEMHTGGEPVRIVVDGFPPIAGETLLAKRRYAREHLDDLRRLLMHEPRGHRDMYGVLPVEPDDPRADLAVLFIHNEGYSTMCGHATIALGRWAVERGLGERVVGEGGGDEVRLRLQCPCGLVEVWVELEDGRPGRTRFESVPAFALARRKMVETHTYGPVEIDLAYGGAFYALVPAATLGLEVPSPSRGITGSAIRQLTDAATEISRAAAEQVELRHPDDPELAFLYGTILTDGHDGSGGRPSANLCVFADAQVDRSPTGSGVTARLAVDWTAGEALLGEARLFESITGAIFEARARTPGRVGPFRAVTVEVAGRAFHSGTATFTVEPDDPLGGGFLLR